MQLIDTHAHLDDERLAGDLPEVLARARQAGVAAVITIGTTVETSRRAVELAEQYEDVFCAVGIQPNYVADAQERDLEAIATLARRPEVVAIGETGLDRHWDYAPFEAQLFWFGRHVALAARLDLPFVVHCREAEADVVQCLRDAAHKAAGPLRGVMHSFTGDLATAQACLELGLHISFAGMVTYPKSQALREVAATVPLDRLLLETDSPYLPPQPRRGKRNEPAFVRFTAECLAEARRVPAEVLAAQTSANARMLFRIP